mmetsp:Transcript_14634/g.31206  ORF Transcript_14634/g.31206 Transcript_14634/m.31206 type:complete len:211 (-) Transcript_14634:1775-2407(-)
MIPTTRSCSLSSSSSLPLALLPLMPQSSANSSVVCTGPVVHLVPMPSLHMLSIKFWMAQQTDLKSCSSSLWFCFGVVVVVVNVGGTARVTTHHPGATVSQSVYPSPPPSPSPPPFISAFSRANFRMVCGPILRNLHGSLSDRLGAAIAHCTARCKTASSTGVVSKTSTVRRPTSRFRKPAEKPLAAPTASKYQGRNSSRNINRPSPSVSR